jgi:hypothetical protein
MPTTTCQRCGGEQFVDVCETGVIETCENGCDQ